MADQEEGDGTTVTLITSDGQEADITELLNDPAKLDRALERAAQAGGTMTDTTTATITGTEEALERIEAAIHERLQEIMPDALKYAGASGSKTSIGMKIELSPDKDIADGWWVTVTPSLSAKGIIAEGRATIEQAGRGKQLNLLGALDPK